MSEKRKSKAISIPKRNSTLIGSCCKLTRNETQARSAITISSKSNYSEHSSPYHKKYLPKNTSNRTNMRQRSPLLPILVVSCLFLATTNLASASFFRWLSKRVERSNAKRKSRIQQSKKKHVIFSTDSSGGLFGPNAGFDECPAVFDNATAIHDLEFDRDVDDLMAIVNALNSPESVAVDLIVPLFGNANMFGNFLAARQIVHVIKGRKKIPIVPGASDASQPAFLDTWRLNPDLDEAGWGGPLPLAKFQKGNNENTFLDPVELFGMSCQNPGVLAMEQELLKAKRQSYSIDLVGIGPMTDLACLLLQIDRTEQMDAIGDLILLIGQEAGVPLSARDFNMVMDPLAAAIVLSFSDRVSIVLMQAGLTFTTSFKSETAILFTPDHLPNNTLPFFVQVKQQGQPTEGPFDQYTLAYSLHPEWFECSQMPAYVIQCDAASSTAKSNTCDSNEATYSSSPTTTCTSNSIYSASNYVKGVSAELTVDTSYTYNGNLVIGNPNGNILSYRDTPAARVTACTGFAEGGYDAFRSFVYNLY